MIGTIRINFIVACAAFFITFLLSVGDNLFWTTCMRSIYSFLILFVLTFLFRWVLGIVIGPYHSFIEEQQEQLSADPQVGSQLDLVTPDEDETTRQMLKQNTQPHQEAESLFSPLNPPKLATKNHLDPEQLAGALRRLSED